jgi:phosphoribosylformylglycinamidine synthase
LSQEPEKVDGFLAKVTITITMKPTLLDAQGRTVEGALKAIGYDGVAGVRVGKVIELELPGSDVATVETTAAEMCDRLLANPVLEDYRIAVTL